MQAHKCTWDEAHNDLDLKNTFKAYSQPFSTLNLPAKSYFTSNYLPLFALSFYDFFRTVALPFKNPLPFDFEAKYVAVSTNHLSELTTILLSSNLLPMQSTNSHINLNHGLICLPSADPNFMNNSLEMGVSKDIPTAVPQSMLTQVEALCILLN